MLLFLWTKREVIMHETAQLKAGQQANPDKPITLSPLALRWGPIYRSYNAHAWYWTPLLLLRRFLFTLTSVLLDGDPARFALYAFLHLTSVIGHVFVQPFEDPLMNRVESASYICLIYLSIALTVQDAPYSVGVQILLALLVIPFAFGLFLWTAKAQVTRCRQRCFRELGNAAVCRTPSVHAADFSAELETPFTSLSDGTSEMEIILPSSRHV